MLRAQLLHELGQSGNQSLRAVRVAGACQFAQAGQIARKRRDRTSVGPIVAVRSPEIGIDIVREGIGGRPALRVTQEPRIPGVAHVADRLGEGVVLRLEERVEAAVSESGAGHHLRHPDALCTLSPDCSGGFGEYAGACSLLVVVVVPHRFPEVFTADVSDNTTISQLCPVADASQLTSW